MAAVRDLLAAGLPVHDDLGRRNSWKILVTNEETRRNNTVPSEGDLEGDLYEALFPTLEDTRQTVEVSSSPAQHVRHYGERGQREDGGIGAACPKPESFTPTRTKWLGRG